jgi:hypothetical protein
MRQRILNPNRKEFPEFGGRGIKMDPRWERLEAFLEDLGLAPPGTILGRVDPNGDYVPGNTRWVTPKELAHLRRPRRWYKKPEAKAAA